MQKERPFPKLNWGLVLILVVLVLITTVVSASLTGNSVYHYSVYEKNTPSIIPKFWSGASVTDTNKNCYDVPLYISGTEEYLGLTGNEICKKATINGNYDCVETTVESLTINYGSTGRRCSAYLSDKSYLEKGSCSAKAQQLNVQSLSCQSTSSGDQKTGSRVYSVKCCRA